MEIQKIGKGAIIGVGARLDVENRRDYKTPRNTFYRIIGKVTDIEITKELLNFNFSHQFNKEWTLTGSYRDNTRRFMYMTWVAETMLCNMQNSQHYSSSWTSPFTQKNHYGRSDELPPANKFIEDITEEMKPTELLGKDYYVCFKALSNGEDLESQAYHTAFFIECSIVDNELKTQRKNNSDYTNIRHLNTISDHVSSYASYESKIQSAVKKDSKRGQIRVELFLFLKKAAGKVKKRSPKLTKKAIRNCEASIKRDKEDIKTLLSRIQDNEALKAELEDLLTTDNKGALMLKMKNPKNPLKAYAEEIFAIMVEAE